MRVVKNQKKHLLYWLVPLVLIVMLAIGLGIYAMMNLIVKKTDPTVYLNAENVVVVSTDTPDEEPLTSEYAWKGAANDPKKIAINGTSINNFIQNVGVDQNGAIAVPTNIHLAGWFVDSVRPGEKGLSIIDGHIDGRTRAGVFDPLTKVKVGDEVVITNGDDTRTTFKVKELRDVTLAEAADVLFEKKSGIERQLNLITCVGKFDKNIQQYDRRLIVIAEAVL